MDRQLEPRPDATQTTIDPHAPPISAAALSSSAFYEDEGRFTAGTLLGGRYRIIGLLGRGGMGEVYRATDLTLGQSVALKFLPEEAGKNQRLLERFHGEVRIARQVSHPNVCRVYDIGEVNGMPFISMEYVDGEDLASLLLRIGRLPAGKAVETARKICAGLAAAHDRGIIHRDLKPHNIMMNKRGEVVIMDFGLAAIAGELSGAEARSGTPAYMAPEQLKGSAVTARSDIYALGLVLYELFTGKRPFQGESLQEMLELQESAQIESMSSSAPDIDPAVERVVRRCLHPEPSGRPPSALAVAAALPGGDPLAAALAAGETPSPELVAASGETEGLPRRYAVTLFAAALLLLGGSVAVRYPGDALMHAPTELSPDVLKRRAREIAVACGYDRKPADTAAWLSSRRSLLSHLAGLPEPRNWREWYAAEGPVMVDYRESQSPLVAVPFGKVDERNPPPIEPGMVRVSVDSNGNLRHFAAVPYDGAQGLAQPVAPEVLFRAAGLDINAFREVDPVQLPTYATDTLRSWKGPHPVIPRTELSIDLGAFKGRVTMFQVRPPWISPASAPKPTPFTMSSVLAQTPFFMVVAFLVLLLMMARRNWRTGRLDGKGALRLATVRFLLALVAWAAGVHFVMDLAIASLFYANIADSLLSAVLVWILYIALEPAVRSRWPHTIVTWNRLLAGKWRDPQVNAHVLIGAVVGTGIWVTATALGVWAGDGDPVNPSTLAHAWGVRSFVELLANNAAAVLTGGLVVFFAIIGLKRLLRKDLLAATAASIGFTALRSDIFQSPDWQIRTVIYLALYAILSFVLLRYGLVAIVSSMFFLNCSNATTVIADASAWFVAPGAAMLALLLTLVTYAFWRCLGSRGLLDADDQVAVAAASRRSGLV